MISTYTTTSIITTTTTPTSVITTPVSPSDIMIYSIVTVVALIVLLALKVITSSEAHKNTKIARLSNGSNLAFLPLLSIFLLSVVLYEIITIL